MSAPASAKSIDVTPSDLFQLEAYAASYHGYTKVERLLLVAERSKKHRPESLKMAIDELKKGSNTITYRKLFEKIGDELGGSYNFDQSWADNQDKKSQQTLERLEMELNGHKTNLIKESIRVRSYNPISYLFLPLTDRFRCCRPGTANWVTFTFLVATLTLRCAPISD